MAPKQTPPRFPERALRSKAVLYRPLQDIDVYVEDEGSEIFYTELLERLIGGGARIATVIPLRGRDNVLKAAQECSDSRPAIFLIDGDLHWVAGLPLPSSPNIFVHPCYCVENYLFCERAMIQIAFENRGCLTKQEVKADLSWNRIREELESHLVPLFLEFAAAFALCPEIKTVSRGIGCILRDVRKGTPPTIDVGKVTAVRQEVKTEILKHVGKDDYHRIRSAIESKVKVLDDPLDIVSGKDFLVPVQMFEAGRVGGQKVQRKSFVFRLARHCNLEKLKALRSRILDMVEPNRVTGDFPPPPIRKDTKAG